MSIQISSSQSSAISGHISSGSYADGYRYAQSIVDSARGSESNPEKSRDLEVLSNWLGNAASINENDGSPKSEFVREATKSAGEQVGKPISDADFQDASDQLARDVLSDIVNGGEIPSADEIIAKDVRAAVDGLGLPAWGWAGTLGDIMPISMGGLGKDFNSIPYEDLQQYLSDLKDTIDASIDGATAAAKAAFNQFNDWWQRAISWIWPRDPLVLDIDGDGIDNVGLSSGVHFDHDADGVLNRSGWIGQDDALLVRDLNSNGKIDTGAELFGDFTRLPNGKLAGNGYTALAALDDNADGLIDANDAAFAELKLWQDRNQDGISQADELTSLSDAGIASLNLANTLKNQRLGNGNTLAREGSFSWANGETGSMAEINVAIDTFDTRFAQDIPLSDAAKSLPAMQGSGNVRELRQAATQSSALQEVLSQFAQTNSRDGQKALLDRLLTKWADTSGMAGSLEERADGKYRIQYDAFGSVTRSANVITSDLSLVAAASPGAGGGSVGSLALGMPLSDLDNRLLTDSYRQLIASWNNKLHVLEAFNGQYFFNLPDQKSQTAGANFGLSVIQGASSGQGGGALAAFSRLSTLRIGFSNGQLQLLDQAYASLKEAAYGALVLQTRLKPYLDQLNLVIDENGVSLDASAMNQALSDKFASYPEAALGDVLDLDRYAGRQLMGTNWSGLATFDQMLESLPRTPAIQALLNEFNVQQLGSGDDSSYAGSTSDIVLAGDGNDVVSKGNGNDRLFGQAGDDQLFGGNGSDLLSGGAGDDVLYGGAGADVYVFGRGYGHDQIVDHEENGRRLDAVRFVGLSPADIALNADFQDNLTFTIKDTGETLRISRYGYWAGTNGVGQFVFEDGTVWSYDDALRSTVAAATEGDDVIQGSSAGDVISGLAGNDTLIGQEGSDLIDGGAGNDVLIGGTGWQYINEGGVWRYERSLAAQTSPNGNDTYAFGRGDGKDTVIDGDYTTGNTDTLRFKVGVTPSDVQVKRIGNDLVLTILGADDQVTLARYFDEQWNGANSPYLIERIAFADGNVWSFDDIQTRLFAGTADNDTIIGSRQGDYLTGQAGNDTLTGRDGDDFLQGGNGDDLLLGGHGQDILDGGAGDDVLRGNAELWSNGSVAYEASSDGDIYRFGYGDGHDTVIDTDWSRTATDRIELKDGIGPDDVRLQRVRVVKSRWQTEENLVLTLRSTGESITVTNHFGESGSDAIEEIVFAGGTVWTADDIRNQVLIGDSGNDVLRGFNGRDDLLQGKAGNDQLMGQSGSDSYLFGLGDGQDEIIESSELDSVDVVILGDGITPADVTVRWTLQGGLAIRLNSGESIVARDQAKPWMGVGAGIEALRFADGTEWDREQLAALATTASDADDVIVGGYGDDVLDGGAGNDHFHDLSYNTWYQNYSGYDTYIFGQGDGHDVIDDVNGRVLFKSGIGQNDVLFTRDGNDLVATLKNGGDTIRMSNWLNNWPGINRFDFFNGASLSKSDIYRLLDAGSNWQVLYGSPQDDLLVGSELNSEIHGREGNDTLQGGQGVTTYRVKTAMTLWMVALTATGCAVAQAAIPILSAVAWILTAFRQHPPQRQMMS